MGTKQEKSVNDRYLILDINCSEGCQEKMVVISYRNKLAEDARTYCKRCNGTIPDPTKSINDLRKFVLYLEEYDYILYQLTQL